MALKLKSLLEGYAWERKADGSLPTLKDAIAVHEANEANSALEIKIAKLEKEIADLKHQYYSVSNLSSERESHLRKQLGEKGRELKRKKREQRTGASGYKKESKEPRWQDNDGDGKWYEPEDINEYGDDETHSISVPDTGVESYDDAYEIKDKMTESFWNRVKGNLNGHEYILREAFRK